MSCAMHKLCLRRTPARPFSLPCQLSSLWQQPLDPQTWSLPPSRPLPAGSMLMGALLRPLSLLLTSMCPSSGTVGAFLLYIPCSCMAALLSCPVRRSDCCIVWPCICPYSIHLQYIMYSIIRSIGCYAVHTCCFLFPSTKFTLITPHLFILAKALLSKLLSNQQLLASRLSLCLVATELCLHADSQSDIPFNFFLPAAV